MLAIYVLNYVVDTTCSQDKESHACICQEPVFWRTGTACHRLWVCDMGELQPWPTIKDTQNSKNVCQANDGYKGQKINTNHRVV